MDLFALFQTAFMIFASLAITILIVSFVSYKIKQSKMNDKEKISAIRNSSGTKNISLARENVVHTVALPEAGKISVMPQPIAIKRRYQTLQETKKPVTASRFKVVDASSIELSLVTSYNPGNSFTRDKFTVVR